MTKVAETVHVDRLFGMLLNRRVGSLELSCVCDLVSSSDLVLLHPMLCVEVYCDEPFHDDHANYRSGRRRPMARVRPTTNQFRESYQY